MGEPAFLGRPWLAGPPGAGLRLIRDYGEMIEWLVATICSTGPVLKNSAAAQSWLRALHARKITAPGARR
jgi:hypothetical protein